MRLQLERNKVSSEIRLKQQMDYNSQFAHQLAREESNASAAFGASPS